MNYLYLHGFASSPQSKKAQDIQKRLSKLQISMFIPDLNTGGFSDLTITRQIQQVTTNFPVNSRPVTLIGSSLGGLISAHIAQQYLQVKRLILLAPAFGFLSHWLPKLGTGLKLWELTKYIMIYHYGYQKLLPLHYNFVKDAHQYSEDLLQRPVPTLILHGKYDKVIPVQASRSFANSRFWVELKEFNSDHALGNVSQEIWQEISLFCQL
ncbi:MAG: YqiA/YcfP family alpha/beta fold hydrolase [Dolichospermum sp.]